MTSTPGRVEAEVGALPRVGAPKPGEAALRVEAQAGAVAAPRLGAAWAAALVAEAAEELEAAAGAP